MDLIGVEEDEELPAVVVMDPLPGPPELAPVALLVDLEALAEAERAVQVRTAREGGSCIAGVAQDFGERVNRWIEGLRGRPAVPEFDAVDGGIQRGKHRQVRRGRLG